MGSIRVSHVGKAYKQYARRWDRLIEWTSPRRSVRHSLKWVLSEISFSIEAGEAVGLIGVNGAGKSTLLKLITGTSTPTTGSISLTGRVAALLELGMGFHPDFTGRENVRIAGQLQGLSVEEIDLLMPQIEAFADIGLYIDAPVRVYSSGMQMRLAFSVATCVRPDILIVDEALSVGDVFFQQKCFDRIGSFTRSGTTLVFVSHSASTILSTCSRCLLLRNGNLAFDGSPKEAIDLYQADLLRSNVGSAQFQVVTSAAVQEPLLGQSNCDLDCDLDNEVCGSLGSVVTGGARCIAARLRDADGEFVHAAVSGHTVTLNVVFQVLQDCHDPHVGFKVRNRFGAVIFETNSYCMKRRLGPAKASAIVAAEFTFALNLAPDEYTVTVGLSNGGFGVGSFDEVLSYLHEVLSFAVLPNPDDITWAGQLNLNPVLHFSVR
jgi:lipopolysaccharide transport system ATP-binding protein